MMLLGNEILNELKNENTLLMKKFKEFEKCNCLMRGMSRNNLAC